MKVVRIHDWLIKMGGGERVLEAMGALFPSPIHTLVCDPYQLKGSPFEEEEVHSSFIQKLPFALKKHALYLPLFPLAIEQFDLFDYDLILSSSHAVAKGVLSHVDQLHICYCHTPMRYAWDLYHHYLKESGLTRGIKGSCAKLILHYLRTWDVSAAARVDHYIANSHFVARRIAKLYGRKAAVIYPPVDVERLTCRAQKEAFYLTASRLVPYKRILLIVEAFLRMPTRQLVIIGEGEERAKIEERIARAQPQNIHFLGFQEASSLHDYLQRARAFVFAALEDFGILPVEAQACGTPVIGYGRGGLLETVVEGKTGLFFREQSVEALTEAVEAFEGCTFDPHLIRAHAERFSKERFKEALKRFVEEKYTAFKEGRCTHSF